MKENVIVGVKEAENFHILIISSDKKYLHTIRKINFLLLSMLNICEAFMYKKNE